MDVSNKFAGEEKNYFKILWKLIPKIPFDSHETLETTVWIQVP